MLASSNTEIMLVFAFHRFSYRNEHQTRQDLNKTVHLRRAPATAFHGHVFIC